VLAVGVRDAAMPRCRDAAMPQCRNAAMIDADDERPYED
jgi:hypothetical protein